MIQAKETYKEELSKHVEGIFKKYVKPGLHICDIATGGGKSYTIGKLTCEYYPKHFDRIVILCVQNKLVEGMNREIDRFIDLQDSLIKEDQKLVIENNTEVIKKAIDTDSFRRFIEQIEHRIGEMKTEGSNNELRYACSKIKKTYEGVKNLILTQGNNNNDFVQAQITEGETKLRRDVRNFFELYKKVYNRQKKGRRLDIGKVLRDFPSLAKVYPQVDYKKKKVLLMTVHKAMYGIDPILGEKISLHDITEKEKKTLILLDESDQAAIAMRNAIIDQAIESSRGKNRFSKGYNGYLQYKQLIDMAEHVSDEYYGSLLDDSLNKANNIISTNWEKTLGKTEPYKNIFLGDIEELEDYRRGVFFSGPALKLNVSKSNDKSHSFICYNKGEKQFKLHHAEDNIELKQRFDYVVPMNKFLSLIVGNTTAIKAQLSKVVNEAFQKSVEKFEKTMLIPILDVNLIDEAYSKVANNGETVAMFKRKKVAHKYLRGYIGFHLWKTDGIDGNPEGSYSYISGTNSESMKITPKTKMDKMPRARRIFILHKENPELIDQQILEICKMLKFGFGRWNELMTYPFPFKFLQEYLDDAAETAYSLHWKDITLRKDL